MAVLEPLRSRNERPDWTFLTNHAHVLICIATDPEMRARDIADHVGIGERATLSIINDLVEAGYVGRSRHGRRNHYSVATDKPLRHPLERDHQIGDLLTALTSPPRRTTRRRSGTA